MRRFTKPYIKLMELERSPPPIQPGKTVTGSEFQSRIWGRQSLFVSEAGFGGIEAAQARGDRPTEQFGASCQSLKVPPQPLSVPLALLCSPCTLISTTQSVLPPAGAVSLVGGR